MFNIADEKLTQLSELTTITDDDIIYVVDSPSSTAVSYKITKANLVKNNTIITFNSEYDNGSKTTDFSVDFINGQKQKCTLTANTMTLTLDTTSIGVGNYVLKIVNGGLATLTWASETGSVLFPGGTAPTLTASGTDIVSFYYDGTDFYGQAGVDFQ